MKVAVVGTGRVGLPLAAVSSKYHETLAIDIDPLVIERINSRATFSEPSLTEYVRTYDLSATSDFTRLQDRELVLVCVGSQSPGEGYSSNNLLKTLDLVAPNLQSETQVLVLVTTLPPLTLEGKVIPYLESHGLLKRVGGLCYNPTMIALGNAIYDFEHPDYLLIGETSAKAGTLVQEFWMRIVGNSVPILRSTPSDVELAKYSLNTALVLKITLMNTLTELSEKVGADIDFQSEVLKADPRIAGQRMFKGGLGYGGTCYPIDVEAFRALCERLAMPTALADAMKTMNDRQVHRTVELIKSLGKKRVSILGTTYKPNTSVVAASQSLQIAEQLAEENYQIMLYDPAGLEGAKIQLGDRAHYSDDIEKAISFGNVVLLGVEWPQIKNLRSESFRRDQVVVDPWRMLSSEHLQCEYIPYGREH